MLRTCAKLLAMTERADDGHVPEWDLADRMRKALRVSGLSVQDMAEYLGVTRGTVSTWINGRIEPSTQTLRLWALRCGVAYGWLSAGGSPSPGLTFPTNPVEIRKPGRLPPSQALLTVAA